MSVQRTILEMEEPMKQPLLTPNSSATYTGGPSKEALLTWGRFLALQTEADYEARVFSTPGVVEALDEAIAEIQAAEDSQ